MGEEVKPGEERYQKIWDILHRDALKKNKLLQGYGESGVTEGQYITYEPGRLVTENGKVIRVGIEYRITEEAKNCFPENSRRYTEKVTGDRRYFLPENRGYSEGLLDENKQPDDRIVDFCKDNLKRFDKLRDRETDVPKLRRKEIESLREAIDNGIIS